MQLVTVSGVGVMIGVCVPVATICGGQISADV